MNSEGIQKSLQEELRFKIGEQYELNEFYLKSLESTFSNGIEYENYEYIKGDFKALFGIAFSSNVILQYNADILYSVIYEFAQKEISNLIKELNIYMPLAKKLDAEKLILGKTFSVFHFQDFSLSLDIERDVKLRVIKFLG
tara:strand:+ start:245 stop:667 length:423 start_codon:yes stop_codon:yes gene_type:complete